MSLIAPDILAEGRDFTIGFCAVGATVGLLIWLTGWRLHRFWIVLVATVTAGIFGLLKAPVVGVQPLLAGLLLAVAAGLLALALVRVIAFAAGGIAAVYGVRLLSPAPWQEPLICFLGGGLLGLLLFRWWTMVLTSFAGTLLMGYFGIWLAEDLGYIDALAFVQVQEPMVNPVFAAVTLAGAAIQLLVDRKLLRRRSDDSDYGQGGLGWRKSYNQGRLIGRRPYRRAG
jgi:hypothetical protein